MSTELAGIVRVNQFSAATGKSPAEVRRLIRTGKVDGYLESDGYVIPYQELVRYIEQRKKPVAQS